MRHDVREAETLRLTVPPQDTEVTIDVRILRMRGHTASMMVVSSNWLVQSEVVHAKRTRGRPRRGKFLDDQARRGVD